MCILHIYWPEQVGHTERVAGFMDYGAVHTEPTDAAMLRQGDNTILFNPANTVGRISLLFQIVSLTCAIAHIAIR